MHAARQSLVPVKDVRSFEGKKGTQNSPDGKILPQCFHDMLWIQHAITNCAQYEYAKRFNSNISIYQTHIPCQGAWLLWVQLFLLTWMASAGLWRFTLVLLWQGWNQRVFNDDGWAMDPFKDQRKQQRRRRKLERCRRKKQRRRRKHQEEIQALCSSDPLHSSFEP